MASAGRADGFIATDNLPGATTAHPFVPLATIGLGHLRQMDAGLIGRGWASLQNGLHGLD
jgi:hypothetical protein